MTSDYSKWCSINPNGVCGLRNGRGGERLGVWRDVKLSKTQWKKISVIFGLWHKFCSLVAGLSLGANLAERGGESRMKKLFVFALALAVAVSFSGVVFAGEAKKAEEKAPAAAPAAPAPAPAPAAPAPAPEKKMEKKGAEKGEKKAEKKGAEKKAEKKGAEKKAEKKGAEKKAEPAPAAPAPEKKAEKKS